MKITQIAAPPVNPSQQRWDERHSQITLTTEQLMQVINWGRRAAANPAEMHGVANWEASDAELMQHLERKLKLKALIQSNQENKPTVDQTLGIVDRFNYRGQRVAIYQSTNKVDYFYTIDSGEASHPFDGITAIQDARQAAKDEIDAPWRKHYGTLSK